MPRYVRNVCQILSQSLIAMRILGPEVLPGNCQAMRVSV